MTQHTHDPAAPGDDTAEMYLRAVTDPDSVDRLVPITPGRRPEPRTHRGTATLELVHADDLPIFEAALNHAAQDPTTSATASRRRVAHAIDVAAVRLELALGYLEELGQSQAADAIRDLHVRLGQAIQAHQVLAGEAAA